MIKLVAFDLDDTLYNEKDFVFGAFKEVSQYLSNKYNLDSENVYSDMINILESQGRGKIFNIICDNYNIKEDIKALVRVYRNARPKLKLYEDSVEVLSKLKYNYKLGLITDGLAYVQWNKIKLLGLEEHFHNIIVTDDLGREYWKPHIISFKNMAEKFRLLPNECVYIGDNPNKDFYGAKKLGYKTIRLVREAGDHIHVRLDCEYEADYEVNDLSKIISIIKGI